MLLETIRSRCEILKFYPVSFEEIKINFQSEISLKNLESFFLIAEGRVGEIIHLIEKSKKGDFSFFERCQKLIDFSLPQRFIFIKNILEGENPQESAINFLDSLEVFLRLNLLGKIGIERKQLESFKNSPKTIREMPLRTLGNLIEKVNSFKNLISSTNISPRLALEDLALMI